MEGREERRSADRGDARRSVSPLALFLGKYRIQDNKNHTRKTKPINKPAALRIKQHRQSANSDMFAVSCFVFCFLARVARFSCSDDLCCLGFLSFLRKRLRVFSLRTRTNAVEMLYKAIRFLFMNFVMALLLASFSSCPRARGLGGLALH